MSKKPTYWNSAIKYLSNKDKVMKKLINQYKDKTLTTRKDNFYSLCKSIIGQQISVAAANSVFKKFKKACKGKINSKVVKKLSFAKLKSCGLSRQKTKGIKELSIKFSNNLPAIYIQIIDYEDEKREDVLYGYPNQIISYPIMPGVILPMWLAEGTAQYMTNKIHFDYQLI